jgi:hypothetical protein
MTATSLSLPSRANRCFLLSLVIAWGPLHYGSAVKPYSVPHETLKIPAAASIGLDATVKGSLAVDHNARTGGLHTVSYARVLSTGYQGISGLYVDKDAYIVEDLVVRGPASLSSSTKVTPAGLTVTGQVNTSGEIWSQGTMRALKNLVVDGDVLVGAGSGTLQVYRLATVRSLQVRVDGA